MRPYESLYSLVQNYTVEVTFVNLSLQSVVYAFSSHDLVSCQWCENDFVDKEISHSGTNFNK